jgi:type 1 glutamine amidotransferase
MILAAAGAGSTALAQTHQPGGAINEMLGDPDYGVCRGTDPKCFHNWPRATTTDYKVLLFTRTAGPRHADLGQPLPPGLNPPLDPSNVVQRELQRLLAANGIKLDYTEDLAVLSQLNAYNAVIFYSTSRDNLDDAGKTSLRQYLRAGGGFVGIHNAFGTLYNWPYYEGLLGNANFYDHGPFREGDVVVVDRKDASTQALPARWHFKDEWYNLVPFPTHVRFLLTVDEKSWTPVPEREAGPPQGSSQVPPPPGLVLPPFLRSPSVVGHDPGHGSFHPVAWCQYYDGGKAWLTTLGHDAGDFSADDTQFPGAKEFQKLIVGGIQSVMGIKPFCQ